MSWKKRTTITKGMEDTIKVMLKSGKVTCDIACEMGISNSAVSRIRTKMVRSGEYPDIWHPSSGGIISNWGRY